MSTAGATTDRECVRAAGGPRQPADITPFTVSVSTVGSHISWLCAVGKLMGDAAARDLAEVLERQCVAGCRIAWLDLTDVPMLDRVGLDAIVRAHRRFVTAGGTLTLTGVTDRLTRLLMLTGLDQTLFTIAAADPPSTSIRHWPHRGNAFDVDAHSAESADLVAAVTGAPMHELIIERAVGVVMGRTGCGAAGATERLMVLSHATGRTLGEVAQSILDDSVRTTRSTRDPYLSHSDLDMVTDPAGGSR